MYSARARRARQGGETRDESLEPHTEGVWRRVRDGFNTEKLEGVFSHRKRLYQFTFCDHGVLAAYVYIYFLSPILRLQVD